MAITAVREYLAGYSLEQEILEFSVSSATVELAAQALGTAPAHIAKSLSFLTKEGPVLVVTAGDAKVDNAKFKALFHEKARMVPFDAVEAVSGHAAGGGGAGCQFTHHEKGKQRGKYAAGTQTQSLGKSGGGCRGLC